MLFSSQHLSKSVLLEESGNPLVTRLVAAFAVVLIGAFLTWSAVARLDEVANAQGKVIPASYVKQVQHLTGGRIEAILVADGDNVEAGQALVTLDTFADRSQLRELENQLTTLAAQRERLVAFLEGRGFAGTEGETALIDNERRVFEEALASRERDRALYEQQIAQRRADLNEMAAREAALIRQRDSLREESKMRTDLFTKGYGSKVSTLSIGRQLSEIEGELGQLPAKRQRVLAQIEEAHSQLARLDGNVREKAVSDLAKIEEDTLKTTEQIERLRDRIEQAVVRAPAAGLVHGLKTRTVGNVIAPTDVILSIVPHERPLAEVRIQPKDIGYVQPGQDVMVRFVAYDFARFGGIAGTLREISATAFEEPNGQSYYRGVVELKDDIVGGDPAKKVFSGMNVQADIRTGEKTMLEYLVKPVARSAQDALRER